MSIRSTARPEHELDAVLLPERVRSEPKPLRLERAGEELFRERRALVWSMGLGADERDVALESLCAERLGAPRSRESGADDDDPSHAACSSITVMAPIGHEAAASTTARVVRSRRRERRRRRRRRPRRRRASALRTSRTRCRGIGRSRCGSARGCSFRLQASRRNERAPDGREDDCEHGGDVEAERGNASRCRRTGRAASRREDPVGRPVEAAPVSHPDPAANPEGRDHEDDQIRRPRRPRRSRQGGSRRARARSARPG